MSIAIVSPQGAYFWWVSMAVIAVRAGRVGAAMTAGLVVVIVLKGIEALIDNI